jgi:hypothetical protein
LQSSFAASAAFAGALPALSSAAECVVPELGRTGEVRGFSALRLERFVYDERFAEAAAAARCAAAHGVALAAVTADVTSLWYHDLDLRWRRAPMTLGGVTTRGALFVLETLAADRGMRVLYRGEHGLGPHGDVAHALAGPESAVAESARRASAETWPLALGRALASCATSTAARSDGGASASRFGRLACRSPAASGARATNLLRTEPLHSWIIAPRAAVGILA